MKNKTQKLIVSIILTNLLFANFAMAQGTTTTPPTTNPDIIPGLNTEGWNRAQRDGAYCVGEFKNSISYYSDKALKTVYNSRPLFNPFGVQLCFIVLADAPDTLAFTSGGIENGTKWRPYQVVTLEETIKLLPQGILKSIVAEQAVMAQNAQVEASKASKILGGFLNAVLSVVNIFILWLAAVVGSIFTTALDWILHSDLPQAITTGWTVVRDLCNVFFILILIVIGLGTILRIKDYSEYGHLLGELVLMALLVNFSMVIATTLIAFVNILISMFAQPIHDIWVVLYRYVNFQDLTGSLPNGWMAGLLQGLSKLLFSFVALATFIALTGLLIIRVVTLYILIILSPLAYTLDILPVTKHYAKEWWSYFIKNLVWVPVALFVMDIGILLSKSMSSRDSAFNIILIMAFFWGAVVAAEHMGAAGGKMVVNFAEKAAHTAFKTGDMWLARGANLKGDSASAKTRRALSNLSIGSWQKGWQQRRQTREHESYLVASAQKQDIFNRAISRHKTDFGLKAEQQLVADEKKLIHTQNNTELIAGMKAALHSKEGEKAFAYAQTLFENYDGNEALSRLHYGTDHKGFQEFIDKEFVPLMGKEKAYRLAYDLSRTAEAANHWNFARSYKGVEGKDGKVNYEKNSEAGTEVLAEIAKMNPQQADRTLNRLGRGFVEVDAEAPELNDDLTIKKDATGNVVMKNARINLGVDTWGHTNRGTIDPLAADKTFNLNTASNYMFNDSTGTLQDNKRLWIHLADKFAKMEPNQIKQAKSLISSVGMAAERDASGNILRYEKSDADVISGKKKEGTVKFRMETEDEIKARVFTTAQAYNFLKVNKITADDLSKYEVLKGKILDYAKTVQSTDPDAGRIIRELS